MDPQAMLQKLLALIFPLLLLGTCTTQAAEVQKSELKEPIKVIGIPNYYPFVIQLPDGQASGLYVEFWQLWSETTGIPVEFVFGPPGENITRMAESERHVLNIFKTESREAIADFSIPIHAVQTGVVYSRDYLVNTPFDSLQNKRIAVMRGSQQYQYLKENYPNHTFLVYLNLEEGIQKLFDGHVDALVGELPSIKNTLTRLGYMGILPVSNEVLYTNTVHAAKLPR